ncbi:MAG: lipoyl(octanoyl) transferase LipB [Candidatus Omnitrophota bacterium]
MIKKIVNLGLIEYGAADRIMRDTVADLKAGSGENTLFFAEFYPVYTIGRSGSPDNLLIDRTVLHERGVGVYDVNRGGDITAHNPGQLVIYPVFDLTGLRKDIGWFLRSLERVIIDTLSDFSLTGETRPGMTGVWVNGKKIASIGVAFSRWVSYHGVSLNVNNDLTFFGGINPCGIKGCPVTSLTEELGRMVDLDRVRSTVEAQSRKIFQVPAHAYA